MRIGVTHESTSETRVSATPTTVKQLVGLGYDVLVEAGAGELSSFADDVYAEAGASIGTAGDAWGSDVVFRVNAPSVEEVSQLHQGSILVALLAPALNPDLLEALRVRGVTALAMDAVPRISRAQSMDVLSSMA
ncbi:MAG: NAD(P)(+) transhydrogenase (Re/Si-specific) subunit alpha, partial [Nocardioides sp.]